MRPYVHSVNELVEQLPPMPEGDPTLFILATADPRDVETATRGDINYYEGNKKGMETHAQEEERWRDMASRHGERMRQINADQADRLQAVIDFYHEHDMLPPAELVETTFMAEEMANMPAELHGMSEFNLSLIEMAESYVQSYKDRLEERETAYIMAKNLRETRNKLGRPAKIATWIGGIMLSAGITFGASHALATSSENDTTAVAETLTYVGAATVLLPVEVMAVGAAANKASKVSARSRARNRIERRERKNDTGI